MLMIGRVADFWVTMNTKLWILIAILCVVQSAYSVDLSAFSGQIGTWFDIYEKGNVLPPPPGLKYCNDTEPGWCCQIEYQCRSLYCHDPVTGDIIDNFVFCKQD
nr:uncharacterized protein LOC106690310 [Halyomorpha halys]